MFCNKAEKMLDEYNWDYDRYSRNGRLMRHLEKCQKCRTLILAENGLSHNIRIVRENAPVTATAFEAFREKLENINDTSTSRDRHVKKSLVRLKTRLGLAIAVMAILVAVAALIPFNVSETVGYEVAIAGVDKNIALNNQEIIPLLMALGMEPEKISSLLDSIENNEIHLTVGDCEETCQLKITDLKTEQDARLVIRAIIELGCCEIEKVMPIFRNQSTNLIRQATRKLFS